jgi:hypothetical protein
MVCLNKQVKELFKLAIKLYIAFWYLYGQEKAQTRFPGNHDINIEFVPVECTATNNNNGNELFSFTII